jgi:hypothetical protein
VFNFAQAELAPKAKEIDELDDFKERSVRLIFYSKNKNKRNNLK